jgi:hypothetical protein
MLQRLYVNNFKCLENFELSLKGLGDELYTKVGKNLPPSDSEGWTIVLMERSSRFLWELQCGKREEQLFTKAMNILVKVIERTGSVNLLTDGERRYRNILFTKTTKGAYSAPFEILTN